MTNFLNRTNDRLESMNQKMKSVVNRYLKTWWHAHHLWIKNGISVLWMPQWKCRSTKMTCQKQLCSINSFSLHRRLASWGSSWILPRAFVLRDHDQSSAIVLSNTYGEISHIKFLLLHIFQISATTLQACLGSTQTFWRTWILCRARLKERLIVICEERLVDKMNRLCMSA